MSATDGKVLPSGIGLLLEMDSPVTAISDGNAQQSFYVDDNPAGGVLPVSFGGQTAHLPAIPSPPYRYFQWNLALPSTGLTRDLAVNLALRGTSTARQTFEVLDGGAIIATVVLNNAFSGAFGGPTNPAPFRDGTLRRDGLPLDWYTLGRYTFATTSLAVRVSCNAEDPSGPNAGRDTWTADCLRVATTDGLTVVRLDPAHPPASIAFPGLQIGDTMQSYQSATSTHPVVEVTGAGAGVRYLFDAAVVRSDLEALSSIGAGNLTAAGDGSVLNPMVLGFTGTLGGAAQPLISSTDPVAHIAEVAVGGILPKYILNAGSPVNVPRSWIVANTAARNMAAIRIYPIACSPPLGAPGTYRAVRQYWNNEDPTIPPPLSNNSDGNWSFVGGGYDGQTYATAGSAPTATWVYGPFKGATYRLSASWTAFPGQSNSVVVTVKDFAGNTLGSHTVNQTIAPSGAADRGVPWQVLGSHATAGESDGLIIVQSNGTSATMVSLAIRFERTSPDDTLRFAPTDTVALIWGAGCVTTLSGGPIPARTAPFVLENRAGGRLVGDPPATHRCEIGYNIQGANSASGAQIYNDLTAQTVDILGPWPSLLGGSRQDFGISSTPLTYQSDGKGSINTEPGDYVLVWKGAGNCEVVSDGNSGCVEDTSRAVYPGTPGASNRRYYTLVATPTQYGVGCNIRVHGTTISGSGPLWNTDVAEAHIYPAGTDLANPAKYRPDMLAREAGMQCKRHLDPLGAVNANATTFLDFNQPQTNVTKGAQPTKVFASIASITNYSGPTPWRLPAPGNTAILVTTTGPHGFSNLQQVHFSDDCNAVVTLASGTTIPLATASLYLFVVDSTRFVTQFGSSGSPMVGTITAPTGQLKVERGNGMPLQDQVEVFNLSPNLKTFQFNVPPTATQDALERCATYLGENLKAGARLRVEWANEVWNSGGPVWLIAQFMTWHLYGANDYIPYQCFASNQVWGWMKPKWVAAGRDPADFRRAMGSQHVNTAVTTKLVNHCVDNGLDIGDELATAPYYLNAPNTGGGGPESSYDPTLRRLTTDQLLDEAEVNVELGDHRSEVPAHLGLITPHFPDVKVCFYEFSPSNMHLSIANSVQHNHAMMRHPRWLAIDARFMGVFIESGCTAIHRFIESFADTGSNDYEVYTGTGQVAYIQGAEQDDIQLDRYNRLDLIQSVAGAAMNLVASRFNAPTTPDFSLSVSGSGPLVQGGTVTRTVTMAALNGFAAPVALSVTSGLPPGVTASFAPGTLTGGALASTLTLTASGSAAVGTATLAIHGLDAAASLAHTVTMPLTVTAAATTPPPPASASARPMRFLPMRRR